MRDRERVCERKIYKNIDSLRNIERYIETERKAHRVRERKCSNAVNKSI